jgi:hypothetical protein
VFEMSDFDQKCFDAINIEKFIALPRNWLINGYKGRFDDTEEFKKYIDDYRNGIDVNIIVGYRLPEECFSPIKYRLMSYMDIEGRLHSANNIIDDDNES